MKVSSSLTCYHSVNVISFSLSHEEAFAVINDCSSISFKLDWNIFNNLPLAVVTDEPVDLTAGRQFQLAGRVVV
jgi:hypothetical protein